MGSAKACQVFCEKLIIALALYMLPMSFLLTYTLILLNYEYEVAKERVLYFDRKYFRKKQVDNLRAL
jgi:hypothetical protein